MKSLIGGLAAALVGVSAAHAGSLDIVYWGKDPHATVVVDGQTYDLNQLDDWVTIKNVGTGAHSLTLYANGTSMSRDFTLSEDNTDSTGGVSGWTWCMDLEDNGVELLNGGNCEDMMDYYFDGW